MSLKTSEIFNIQPMTINDLNDVLKIEAVCGLGAGNKADLEKELLDDAAVLIISKTTEEINGYLVARLITNAVEVLSIGVLPFYRGRGVGQALLQKALEIAFEKGASESWLEVRESNLAAQNFYLSRGYKVVGKRPNYYSNPSESAILMTFNFSDYYPKN